MPSVVPHEVGVCNRPAGVLPFWIVMAPLQQLEPNRADTPGMTAVGLVAVLLLIGLRRRVWRRTPTEVVATPR